MRDFPSPNFQCLSRGGGLRVEKNWSSLDYKTMDPLTTTWGIKASATFRGSAEKREQHSPPNHREKLTSNRGQEMAHKNRN